MLLDCDDQGGLGAVGVPVGQVLDVTPHKIVHGVAIRTAERPMCERNKVIAINLQPGLCYLGFVGWSFGLTDLTRPLSFMPSDRNWPVCLL